MGVAMLSVRVAAEDGVAEREASDDAREYANLERHRQQH